MKPITFLLFLLSLCSAEKEPKHLCSRGKSVERWISNSSTLSLNQSKIDISFYDISIDINFESSTIIGSVVVNGFIDNNLPEYIELDFYNNMEVNSILQNNGQVSFLHEQNKIKIPINNIIIQDNNYFSILIKYQGTPQDCGAGGFKFDEHLGVDHVWTLSEAYCARSWWPSKDDPSDKADSVYVRVTVPANPNFIVASNGLLDSITNDGDKNTFFWKEKYPITTYLVSLAIYPYTIWSEQYISSISNDTMAIEHYVFPDRYESSFSNYSLTGEMISFFSGLFGEYPFISEKYGHADFKWGGGMEHQTLSSMGSSSQNLIVHELGHSWWGNLITCKTFNDIWLNEGFARYCQALWVEHINGKEAYFSFMNDYAYYGDGTIYVENPSSNSQIFNSNLSYNKASWVLHMLRRKVGDDTFFEILKSYASNDTLAYNAASTADFQKISEDISDQNLELFFQQWIYEEGYPKYEMSWWHDGNATYKVKIDQIQSGGLFSMPIDLNFSGSIGPLLIDTIIVVENNSLNHLYEISGLNFIVENVTLDPNNWILKEVSYTTNGIDNLLPENVNVQLAYPNPFNSNLKLSFYVHPVLGNQNISINVFNINGGLVESLTKKMFQSGFHKESWNAKGKPAGVYLIQLSTDNYVNTQKVIYLK
ncbi:T9SS type A sorting domain-containing protein [bacterium]|nr:T9SS type A sorting domain-containing protein [bacterium]